MIKYILLLLCVFYSVYCSKQAVTAEGMLVCHGKPYKDAKIKIYEEDPCKKNRSIISLLYCPFSQVEIFNIRLDISLFSRLKYQINI